jgi:hypothetical protein
MRKESSSLEQMVPEFIRRNGALDCSRTNWNQGFETVIMDAVGGIRLVTFLISRGFGGDEVLHKQKVLD